MIIGSINSDIIKILFNANKEEMLIGDIIKIYNSENNGILAQVFKIENSKKTASNNIASVKIILTLKEDNWNEWQGNIPSKEFEIKKVSGKELISYLKEIKQTNPVSLGSLPLYNNLKIDIEAAKLEKPTIVFSDKQYQKINISYLLAQELVKNKAKVVIFDFNGEYSHITTANRIEAGKNFKLPLNSKGIDNIYEKSLFNASAETRAVIEDIFMSVQEYTESCELNFIPFSHFKKVVNDEYEESKIAELILLKNKLTKLEKQNIFANNKFETESLKICIENSNFTIVDFSKISSIWHKDFVDYIIDSNIYNNKQRFFTIFSATETNIDVNLIDKLFIHGYKSGIKPLVSIDYKSKFVNNLLSIAKNVILFTPEMNSDKLPDFDVFLRKLNTREVLIYGEATNYIPLIVKIDETSSEYEFNENNKIFDEIYPAVEIEYSDQKESFYQSEFQEIEKNNSNFYLDEAEQIEEDETQDNTDYMNYEYENIEDLENYQFAQKESLYKEENDIVFEELNFDDNEEYIEDSSKEKGYILNNDNEDIEDEISIEDLMEETQDENIEIYNDSNLQQENINQDSLEDEILNKEKALYKAPTADIPIYSTADPEKEEENFKYEEGDTIQHNKYGTGIIKKIIEYGNKKLCSIQFENVGRRLLDPSLTILEKV